MSAGGYGIEYQIVASTEHHRNRARTWDAWATGEQKANSRTFKMNAPSDVLELYNLMYSSFTDDVAEVDNQLRLYKEVRQRLFKASLGSSGGRSIW